MSDLLQIGASGIGAYQTALNAIGQNVSNASTPGYTRRSVTTAVQIGGTTNLNNGGVAGFGGVRVVGVGRAWDDYQAMAVRASAGDAGRADARLQWLSATETALPDDETGVGQSATAFFGTADTLAANPGDTGGRKAFLTALDQTATAFRTTAASLASTSDGIAQAAQTGVQTVNGSLDSLDKINAAIRASQPGTAAAADLLDQRDQMLDGIAGQVAIDVSLSPDGTATVRLSGSGVTLASGTAMGGASARLGVQSSSDGRLSVQATSGTQTRPVGDVGGTLGGLVDAADTNAGRREALDALASDFASKLNAWSAAGTDANGAPGAPLLTGTDAASLTLATNDPVKVPAASATTANGNLIALQDLRGSDGVESGWNAMVTDQGSMVASAKTADTAAASRADAAKAARDQTTGVDLDTEAAELVRYQQAYSASAKIIQTARETLQSILDIL